MINDPLWLDVINHSKIYKNQRVVGPDELSNCNLGSEYKGYSSLNEGFKPQVWILHRGLPEKWWTYASSFLQSRRYQILYSNEVFTILRKTKLRKFSETSSNSSHETHFFELLKTLRSESKMLMKNMPFGLNTVNKYDIDALVRQMVDLGGWEKPNQPNTSSTGEVLRDIRILRENIKVLAWRIAEFDSPPPINENFLLADALQRSEKSFQLSSRICTSRDIYSEWHRRLAYILRTNNYKLRKIWEWTFTIQALHNLKLLNPDSTGMGFGCGTEPLPSVFANFVKELLVTDAPIDVIDGKGWSDTEQHTSDLEKVKYNWLCPQEKLDKTLKFRYVDMNQIPADINNSFDFVWSSCALEHLGSKAKGLDFIVNSSRCLKPGGVAIHTTEFDLSESSCIDNWSTVLYTKEDIVAFSKSLKTSSDSNLALELIDLDFSRGDSFIDGYVDIPPYSYHANLNETFIDALGKTINFNYPFPQLNLSVDGFPCTAIALVIRRNA